ncbi:MAG: GTPase HflX [Bdellovibrionota bacterium]
MIDLESFQIPLSAKQALIVSDSEWGLEELEGLLTTMGGTAQERLKLPENHRINPGTYLGKGKVEEVKRILEARNLDMLLVDFDLSPSQLKNLEKALKKLILDRSGIILEIFNRHARTKEAKLQVEMARLQYLMPRLTHLWSHFERQRGSGGGALKGKGMGEKQIEVDRRLVKERINTIARKLKEVEGARQLHRRHRDALLKVAIVGYTNAGKSTLLNALTRSDVLVENALFATLDATVRCLNPKSRPIVLGIDTVGFIDRLPHGLVASFRSTLGEILEADLLLHVLDASHPEVRRHFDVTMGVLEELGAKNIPMMIVFNKMDLCENPSLVKVWGASLMREFSTVTPLYISAQSPAQVDEARKSIMAFFERGMETYEVVIPFEDGKTVAQIHELGNVEAKRTTDKGIFFRVRTMKEFANQLNLGRYKI